MNPLRRIYVKLSQRTQMKIVGIEPLGSFAICSLDLRKAQFWFDRASNAAGNLVLKYENVVERLVKSLCPRYALQSWCRSVGR
jgi:hypothetical protein